MPRGAKRVVKSGKDTEESHGINEQMNGLREMKIRVSSRKDNRKNQDDLNSSRRLAVDAWRKRPIAGNEQDHNGHDQNQNVAAENDNREPPGNLLLERQNNERRREQEFIRDRIEIGAERRALIEAACEQAVNSVRKPGHDKHQQRPLILLVGNQDEKERQEAEAQQSDLIGNRPDAAFHCSSE